MINDRYAAIDIGTNTFRLFIAQVRRNPDTGRTIIEEVYSERIITRIGEGIAWDRRITDEAMKRALDALTKFSIIIDKYGSLQTAAVATSAVREASNSDVFIRKAEQSSGIHIKTITGEEEARIAVSGMLSDIDIPVSAVMIDIGGGSTEISAAENGLHNHVESIPMGVVYLASKYMQHDPPLPQHLRSMDQEITDTLSSAANRFAKYRSEDSVLMGTAGTITTLSAVHQKLAAFEHHKIHKSLLQINTIQDIYSMISQVTMKERSKYIPFEPARLDIIVPGTLILLRLMNTFGFREITVSNYGLREGIILDMARKQGL